MEVKRQALHTPSAWKNDRAREIALTDLQLIHQSLVYRLCRNYISRMIQNPHIRPRWKREEKNRKKKCNDTLFSVLGVGIREEVVNTLDCESLPHPTPLCCRHYHLTLHASGFGGMSPEAYTTINLLKVDRQHWGTTIHS